MATKGSSVHGTSSESYKGGNGSSAILQRKKDTFVGRLRVEKDIAFLVTQENLFIHDILIPKKKLKGGKTGDRAW